MQPRSLTIAFLASSLVLFGCNNTQTVENQAVEAEPSENQTTEVPKLPGLKLPHSCKQPAPVQDIWRLEPILIKKGKIIDSMTKVEKQTIINQYIAKKNEQYQICIKKLNTKGKK